MILSGAPKQRGVALVVALLFLLVVTVISVIAASNSTLGLKMSANLQDSYASFQSAEAGAIAALSLAGTTHDPFDGIFRTDPNDPFASITPHPLRDLSDGPASVDVEVHLTNADTVCPRSAAGTSVGLFDCDYYRIASEHEVPREARTKVELGVVKTIIGSGAQ
jgi:type IV pilus assembly protein PilX